ncbi:MAG: hypothetical protein JSW71_10220 [Gemmatimonadota bacterium]|nr:MAG: hypothetical protein JSW71_10220 [Gemmatimonadota bacterium]
MGTAPYYQAGSVNAQVATGHRTVFSVFAVADGVGACTVSLRNGGAAGTIQWTGVSAGINLPVSHVFRGMDFDQGIYVDLTNVAYVSIEYR